jgi:hypothetical protein
MGLHYECPGHTAGLGTVAAQLEQLWMSSTGGLSSIEEHYTRIRSMGGCAKDVQ